MVGHLLKMAALVEAWDPTAGSYSFIYYLPICMAKAKAYFRSGNTQ